jgi:hypothetical protein
VGKILEFPKKHILHSRILKVRSRFIVEQIGTSNILTLLCRPEVSAVYCKEMLYTAKHSIGISPYYNCVAGFLAGDQNAGIIGARTHFFSVTLRAEYGLTINS